MSNKFQFNMYVFHILTFTIRICFNTNIFTQYDIFTIIANNYFNRLNFFMTMRLHIFGLKFWLCIRNFFFFLTLIQTSVVNRITPLIWRGKHRILKT